MTPNPAELMPFVEADKLAHPPITASNLNGHNTEKYSEVYCAKCVYRTKTNLPAPRCGVCHNPLFVVVKSMLTSEQRDELAGNNR